MFRSSPKAPGSPSDFEPKVRFSAAPLATAARVVTDPMKGRREGRASARSEIVRELGVASPVDAGVGAQEDEVKESVNYRYEKAEEKVALARRSAETDKAAATSALVRLSKNVAQEEAALAALGRRERGRLSVMVAVTVLCFLGQLAADIPALVAASFVPVPLALLIAALVGGLFAFAAHETGTRAAELRAEHLVGKDEEVRADAWRRFMIRHGWLPLAVVLAITWWRIVNFEGLARLLDLPELSASVLPVNALLFGLSVGTYVLAVLACARYMWFKPVAIQAKKLRRAAEAMKVEEERRTEAERIIGICDAASPFLARRRAARIAAIERRKEQRLGRVAHAREISHSRVERALARRERKLGAGR